MNRASLDESQSGPQRSQRREQVANTVLHVIPLFAPYEAGSFSDPVLVRLLCVASCWHGA